MVKKQLNGIKVTNIGCGAFGCQMVDAVMKEVSKISGDKSIISDIGINTSEEDLAVVELSHKLHLKGSYGAGGERMRSKEQLSENIEEIYNDLKKFIVKDSIIMLYFSLGGGTGSTVGIELAKILSEEGCKICVTTVLPSEDESLKIKDNAIQTFNELDELKPYIGSIFILDNDSSIDKMMINKVFASMFVSVLCIKNTSQNGNMDKQEIIDCLLCPSFSMITKTNVEKGTTGSIVDIITGSNIFAGRNHNDKTVSIIGISEAVEKKDSQLNMNEFHKEIGIAPKEFHGYYSESGENIIILSGMTMPYDRIDSMGEDINNNVDILKYSVNAITQTRNANITSIFAQSFTPQRNVSNNHNHTLSSFEKLKAMRVSK